jgi:hypothetical protein
MTGFTLPQSERLPDELDEETKRIRFLETRIASFENRQPRLALTFKDETTSAKIKLLAVDDPLPPRAYFDYKISRSSLERYLAKHEEYQTKYKAWAEQAALRFSVGLVLENDGSAVATDILLTLSFPEFITALPDRAVLRRPEPPKDPLNPLLGAPTTMATFHSPIMPRIAQPSDAHINTRDNTVTFRIPTLVHGRMACTRFG